MSNEKGLSKEIPDEATEGPRADACRKRPPAATTWGTLPKRVPGSVPPGVPQSRPPRGS